MGLIEDVVQKTLDRMSPAERHDLILGVVDRMMCQLTAGERAALMRNVVERFMEGLTAEEKQATVHELVPQLMAQLMQSGNMNVDELLWAAMGSLNALEPKGDLESSNAENGASALPGTMPGDLQGTPSMESSRRALPE